MPDGDRLVAIECLVDESSSHCFRSGQHLDKPGTYFVQMPAFVW